LVEALRVARGSIPYNARAAFRMHRCGANRVQKAFHCLARRLKEHCHENARPIRRSDTNYRPGFAGGLTLPGVRDTSAHLALSPIHDR
jgi:hypothetical protein